LQNPHIFIAIPLLDELDNIHSLLDRIKLQSFSNFSVYFCVNQPDIWWQDNLKVNICRRNIETINIIQDYSKSINNEIKIIDKCSKGNGWQGKKIGVGWARKTIIDEINTIAKDDDIIISLDGDTDFSKDYFKSITDNFQLHNEIDTISVPYYHPLNEDENANRAILRYEIYMRTYLLNLMRIRSPYSFSALGSAIAFRVKALRKIGGFTPKKSGEDFYFLQKMVKYKPISNWNEEKVKPAARFSDRVFFGTGPAMIKGNNGDWSSYPIYSMSSFDRIKHFYSLIPKLYIEDIDSPIDDFLIKNSVNKNELWQKLRTNNKDLPHFIKAVHDYFDGLRILQFLKSTNANSNDNENLITFIQKLSYPEISKPIFKNFDFENSSISQLNEIRDYLCQIENIERKHINYTNGE
jgi:hypothetical protein